ncbi:MAG: HAD-IIIA family hydrolase [Candidatus Omnitrophica bacterium]|nr:HAD-IIIA family hydrolase [Candidatus Omnitrophota bacterium]
MKPEELKIIFLDRDGVINEFPGMGNYVVSLGDFRMIPGSAKAVGLLCRAGFEVHVITNQGCVSRGLLSREGLDKIHQRMRAEIEKEGGDLAGIFYCPHQTSDVCDCKKPRTTLFLKAVAERRVDFSNVYFIGDSEEDILAGKNLGCKTVLVLSGRIPETQTGKLPVQPDFIKQDLWEAAQWITQEKS